LGDHYKYVAGKLPQIWCGTFQEVIKYIRERMSATVTIVSATESGIRLTISDTLPDNAYNFPLTVKTEVPATWSSVVVIQGTDTQTVKSAEESGVRYAYYNSVPDRGAVSLYKEGQTLVKNISGLITRGSLDPGYGSAVFSIQGRALTPAQVNRPAGCAGEWLPDGIYIVSSPGQKNVKKIFGGLINRN
jgi:hypothetical protein